jgi:putative tricarboxylic transport membrane protein
MDVLLISLDALISPALLAAAFGGVLWGIIGGALPGISPSITMALLLPFTSSLPPMSVLNMADPSRLF